MHRIILFLIFSLISVTLNAQNNYKVTKDGNGNFSTIKEVNNANLNSGDIVSFKSGQQFDDAVLKCKEGITYNTYGGTAKSKIGGGNNNFKTSISISNKGVVIDNLYIIGNDNADHLLTYSSGGWTLRNCELIGGSNGHSSWFIGIYSATPGINERIQITNNIIHDMNGGLEISQPFNIEVSYNKMYDFYKWDGYANNGGYAMRFHQGGAKDSWDAKYSVRIINNDVYNFEYVILATAQVSRLLVEYNEFHHNLDERIYRGGVKHGSIGKMYDNTIVNGGNNAQIIGTIGTVFRYNYVHDLIRRGNKNYTYGIQTPELIKNNKFTVVSTNNGVGQALYLGSGGNGALGEHYGDVPGESPDAIISGLGYCNMWIHNNIFANCSNRLFTRTAIDGTAYGNTVFRPELSGYLLNNTIINCGYLDYITDENCFINTEWQMYSNQYIINNIIDFTNMNSLAAIRIKGNKNANSGNVYIDNNIYLNQAGVSNTVPSFGKKVALWFSESKINQLSGDGEQYNAKPNWVDINSTIFASNIGPNGTNIPDVRIKTGGNANNKGRDFNLLGDTYSDPLSKHQLGEDPTGRSFAYDLLGNLRLTNDIGAVGIVDGGGIITPPDSPKAPIITVQPTNASAVQGSDATFSVIATCEDPIGYQWWKSPFVSESESKIVNNSKFSGATTNTLTINNVESSDSEINYVCEVYNTKDHKNLWVNSNAASLQISSPNPGGNSKLVAGLKVFLEATFKENSLNLTLNHAGAFPLKQPYHSDPWKYNVDIKTDDIKPNYVDWVLIELRSDLTNTKYRKAGILSENGIILNTDGTNFSFDNILSDNYYIVINHRNHLSIMSSKKVAITNRVGLNYDFTTSENSAYGDNSQIKLGNEKYGMFAGDADANGVVNNLDFGIVANNIPQKGYYQGDLDMNGVINVLDYSLINKNILKSTNVPNN